MKTLEEELMEIFELIHLGYDSHHKKAAKKVIELLDKWGSQKITQGLSKTNGTTAEME
jgi:hypothetical protein